MPGVLAKRLEYLSRPVIENANESSFVTLRQSLVEVLPFLRVLLKIVNLKVLIRHRLNDLVGPHHHAFLW